jgi:hypothetical protein
MRWAAMTMLVTAWLLGDGAARGAPLTLVNDPLNGSTTGIQQGGSWAAGGGWQAAAGDVRITYDLGAAYGAGTFEVDVRNYDPCNQPNNEKCHILSMWQNEKRRQDSHDAGEGHWIFRTGTGYNPPLNPSLCSPPPADCCEYKLLTRPTVPATQDGHEARIDTGFIWNLATTYHYTITWEANGRVRLWKDSTLLYDHTHGQPLFVRYLLVGRDEETKPNYGEQPGVIYANVFVEVDDAVSLCEDPCDDGDLCTVNDQCSGTACTGTPVTCDTPPTVCHEALGTCNPSSGSCDYSLLPNGTGCPGGTCQLGTCVPATDAGVGPDGGVATDGGATPDGGSAGGDGGDPGAGPGASGGCQCRAGADFPLSRFVWIALILGFVIYRRIRRTT